MKNIVQFTEKLKSEFPRSRVIAPLELDTSSASQAYAKGAKFIYNGIMYQAKTDIAQGAALVLNTNYEAAPDVETQIANEAAARSQMGAKNLLPFDLDAIKELNTAGTWSSNVYSYRGVDFTVNPDGTILADGQATGGNASIKVFAATSSYEMRGKNVILNGCPSGGSATSYRIQAYRMGSVDGSSGTYFDDGDGTIAFDALNNASGTVGSFAVAVYENYDADNLLFKPMVRLATDSDGTYQPYAKTNKELTDDVSSLNTAIANEAEARAKLTAHQLLDVSLSHMIASQSGGTWSGNVFTPSSSTASGHLKFTLNDDLSITASGTAQANCILYLSVTGGDSNIAALVDLDADLNLSGCPIGGSNQTYYIQWYGATENSYLDTGSGVNVHPTSKTGYLRIVVISGYTANNLVFKPLIKLASDLSNAYTPYVPTNAELLPADTNAVLGAHNWFTSDKPSGMAAYTTCTKENNGVRIANSQAGTYSYFELIQNLEKNTVYTLSTDVTVTSGMAGILIKGDSSNIEFKQNVSGSVQFTFNSGNYTTIKVVLYATIGTSAVGSVLYDNFLLRLASDPSTEYAPYAMTNRELTEDLNGNYAVVSLANYVDVTPDGTETNETFLKRFRVASLNLINAALGTNETFKIKGFTYNSRAFAVGPLGNVLGGFNDDFYYALKIEAVQFDCRAIQPYSGLYFGFKFYNGTCSIDDIKSQTASGTLRVFYDKYKKIV